MKKLEKLKKNFVINTLFIEKYDFNEPVYLIDSNKEFVTAYNTKKGNVTIQKIKIDEKLNTKTFITVKDFFKKCNKDNTQYKIEKVENGDIYIRVAYYGDLSLFYKLSYKTLQNNFILTNIKKYKFYKTNFNAQEALNKSDLNYLQKEKIVYYLTRLKNIKRDYSFSLKKSKEKLEKLITE